MTTTRRQVSATTPRSCVIRITAAPVRSFSSQHQVEDLRLDGDVERGGRLVGDQQASDCRRAPSRSSRAGACRRRTGADSRRARRSASGMRTSRSISTARARAALALAPVWMRTASAIWSPTVSTGLRLRHRLLEDHRDAVAAQLAHLGFVRASTRSRPSNVTLPPTVRREARRQQAHHRERGDALAAAGFADDAERLAGDDVEATRRRPRA